MRGAVTTIFIFFSLFSPALADRAADFEEARRAYLKLAAQDDYEAALPHAIKAYKLGAKLYEPDAELLASLALELGKTYRRLSNHRKAVPVLKKSLATHERIYGPGHSELVEPTVELAETLSLARRFNSAMRKFEDALTLIERTHGKAHPLYADVLLRMGETMLVRLKPRKAAPYIESARKIFDSHPPGNPDGAFSTYARLVSAFSELDRDEIATKYALAAAKAKAAPASELRGPWPLYQPHPKLPSHTWSDFVDVKFTVSAEGRVKDYKVLHSGFEKPHAAVRKAVSRWRYAPATKGSQLVEAADLEMTIRWETKENCRSSVQLHRKPSEDNIIHVCKWNESASFDSVFGGPY